jgi:hypothetical protein
MSEYQDWADELLAPTESLFIRWFDDRIGRTYAIVVGGEVGDPLSESNLFAASRILGQWVDGSDEAEVFESTVGRSGRTWLRFLAVRVYEDDGTFTDAWCTAVDLILEPLENYPLLDEDDYSDREWEATYELLALDYGKDGAELAVEAIATLGHASVPEYIGDHDEVVLVLEEYLSSGAHGDAPVLLGGLVHYIEQRKNELDIPTLAALVG